MGIKLHGERDEVRHFLDIEAVDRRVDGQCKPGFAGPSCDRALLFMSAVIPSHQLRGVGTCALKTHLNMPKIGVPERKQTVAGEGDVRRDQVRIDATF